VNATQKVFESEDGALVLLAQGRLKEAMAKLSALQHELEELGVACPRAQIEMIELPKGDRDEDPAEAYVDYSNGKQRRSTRKEHIMAGWEYLEVWESPPGVPMKVFIGYQGQEAQGTLEQTVSDLLKQGWMVYSQWVRAPAGTLQVDREKMVVLKRRKQDSD